MFPETILEACALAEIRPRDLISQAVSDSRIPFTNFSEVVEQNYLKASQGKWHELPDYIRHYAERIRTVYRAKSTPAHS